MNYSIIIINYNLSNEIRNCIHSLLKVVNVFDFDIILVDNHSEDEAIIKIAEELKHDTKLKLTFIRIEKNIGFGNACNLAVKESSGEILFFLNPDTLIKENIFQKVMNELKNDIQNRGILGLNVSNKKSIDLSAGYFPNYFFEVLNILSLGRYFEAIYVKLKVIFSRTKRIKVDWVMGAALVIGRDLFEAVNGFDPDYFLYFEEMDLCKRVIQRGLSVDYLPNVKVEHFGSASSKKNYYFFTKMFYKGKLLFLKKHSNNLEFHIYKILLFLHIINQIIFWWFIKSKSGEKSLGKIKAFKEILYNLNFPEKISNLS